MKGLLDSPVLVLNLNYEPLNVCNVKRAIVLVVVGKAEVLENSRGLIRTPSTTYLCPSVIKLGYMIRHKQLLHQCYLWCQLYYYNCQN